MNSVRARALVARLDVELDDIAVYPVLMSVVYLIAFAVGYFRYR